MEFPKKFRTCDGNYVDVVSHTLKILKKHPNAKIYIGTDSQNVKRKTNYVCVIAYRYGNKGVHYIYNKIKIPRIKDRFQRLFKETEISIEIAQWFTQQISVDITIDLDYNISPQHESYLALNASMGWVGSLGFKVSPKGNEQVAVKAADYHVR